MDIPQDLWPLIASFMDDKTKRQMRLASIKWFSIIKYNNFSLYFTKKEDIPVIINRLSKYSWPIELSFNKKKFHNTLDLANNLHKLTNIVKLNDSKYSEAFLQDDAKDQWRQLSTLTDLQDFSMFYCLPEDMWHLYPKLARWDQNEVPSSVDLKLLTNLQHISFSTKSSTWISTMISHPDKLTYLNMYYDGQEFGSEMWSHLPNLKVLKLTTKNIFANDIAFSYLTALESCNLYCRTVPAFSKNARLTKLSVQSENWPISNATTISNLRNLEALSIDIKPTVDVQYITSLVTVKKLKLYRFPDDSYRYLTHFTNLTTLILQPQFNALLNGKAIEQLTRLEKIRYIGGSSKKYFEEFEVPDLTNHANLTYLHWSGGLRPCPDKIVQSLKYLTNLESLRILVENYEINFLADLTKLTALSMEREFHNEYFWKDLEKLTNLRDLALVHIDNDDRLLPLQNLTKLRICSASESFDGRHFTALTLLQKISFKGNGNQLVHRKELTSLLPYLYIYKYDASDEAPTAHNNNNDT